jgi:hypothetical protein
LNVKCRNESDTSNNSGNWNHFRIIIKYPSKVPGKREIKELQKAAMLDAAHILREVTGESIRRTSWKIILRVAYTVTTEDLKHYTP